jgi:hypothetical protein
MFEPVVATWEALRDILIHSKLLPSCFSTEARIGGKAQNGILVEGREAESFPDTGG